MKWNIIGLSILMLLQTGCTCTRLVDRLGETRINVSEPRCVHLMSDGSMVVEASLRHERAKNNALVREDPRYFIIPKSIITTELTRANKYKNVTIALTRNNCTMYPDTLARCNPKQITFPVEATITSTFGPKTHPGVNVSYDAFGQLYRIKVNRSYHFGPTYKTLGYKTLSYLLYVPAVLIDTVTFPIQVATWRYGPGP